jgi:hypothetical protein
LYALSVPSPKRESTRSPSLDHLRDDALRDLELLLEKVAALRGELRRFETPLRRARAHLARGGTATDLHSVIDIVTARETLSRAALEFESIRHTSRISIFRMQVAEGMSLGAIARDWGVSRQLVSRMMKEPRKTGRA